VLTYAGRQVKIATRHICHVSPDCEGGRRRICQGRTGRITHEGNLNQFHVDFCSFSPGREIFQVISGRFQTAAVRVPSQVKSRVISGGRTTLEQVIPEYIVSRLPILIPLNILPSSISVLSTIRSLDTESGFKQAIQNYFFSISR
jgi:hypothetical protein